MYNCKLNIIEAEEDQNNLLNNIVEFDNKSRPRSKEGMDKRDSYESANVLQYGRELTLNAFKGGIFPIKATKSKKLKILTPKQMLLRLLIILLQVKVSDTSESLINEIR